MLEISNIHEKTQVILQAFPTPLIEQCEGACTRFFKKFPENQYLNITPSILSITILYSFARNFNYLESGLFHEVLGAEISECHKLTKADSISLIVELKKQFSNQNNNHTDSDIDAEFFDYIISEVMTTNNLQDTAKNIGISLSEITRITKIINNDNTSVAEIEFLNNFDSKVIEHTEKIQRENDKLWKVDLYRLKLRHSDYAEIQRLDINQDKSVTLEICSLIGKSRHVNIRGVSDYLEKNFSEAVSRKVSLFMEFLEKTKMISECGQKGFTKNYMLTQYGFDISANYFASKTLEYHCGHKLPCFHKKWTEALIKDKRSLRYIRDIIENDESISDDTIEIIYKGITAFGDMELSKKFYTFLQRKVKHSSNPFIRAACLSILSKGYNAEIDQDYFLKVFQEDLSPTVKSKALERLMLT